MLINGKDIWAWLERLGRGAWLVAGLLGTMAVGLVDLVTGYEFTLAPVYMLPVGAVAWYVGRGAALALVAIALPWLAVDLWLNVSSLSNAGIVWVVLARLLFLVIVALLLSSLRHALDEARRLARTDALTDAVNSRRFIELVNAEIGRLARYRHPFTLAYMDLDNFKQVNDSLGHSSGDRLLKTVVETLRNRLRRTDVVARMGGDEFALLLPETSAQVGAPVLRQVREELLAVVRGNDWPVTFSIGVVTCTAAPQSADALLHFVDGLMYSVKKDRKDAIRFAIYP